MNLYKIVNPSDPYTIEAASLDVAAMACILLGQGHYLLKPLDGGEEVPQFIFGGQDKWCRDHFSEDFVEFSNRVMDTKMADVADCLDSVLYGDHEDRLEFLAATEHMGREEFEAARLARQDDRRSSINDIGERAYRMAAKLRKSIADGINTLQ